MSLASAGFKGLTVHPGKDMCISVKRNQCGSDPNQKIGRKQRRGVFKVTRGTLSSLVPSFFDSDVSCCLTWLPICYQSASPLSEWTKSERGSELLLL